MQQHFAKSALFWLRRIHLILGILVTIPLLAWSVSGLLLAIPPGAVSGQTYHAIEAQRVVIGPDEALRLISDQGGVDIKATALTLEQVGDQLRYSVFSGSGSFRVNAETGHISLPPPPSAYTRWVRQAHFFNFAGEHRTALLIGLALLCVLSNLSGLLLIGHLAFRKAKAGNVHD